MHEVLEGGVFCSCFVVLAVETFARGLFFYFQIMGRYGRILVNKYFPEITLYIFIVIHNSIFIERKS